MATFAASPPTLDGMVIGNAASRPDTVSGLDAAFSSAFQGMLAKAPPHVRDELKVTSGYRSPELQAQLWKDALKKYGSPAAARKHVAPPGKSQHNRGMALDLSYASDRTKQWVHDNAKQYGLAFPLQHEPWHMELATARKREIPADAVQGGEGNTTAMGGEGQSQDYLSAADNQRLFDMYQSGKMTPEQEKDYIRTVADGVIVAPGAMRMPDSLWTSYRSGQLSPEQERDLAKAVEDGVFVPPTADMGILETVGDLVAGSARRVESTEALPDIGDMPEWTANIGADMRQEGESYADAMARRFQESSQGQGVDERLMAAKSAPPAEKVKILQATFPGMEVRQDAAGNFIVKSTIDGKEYAIKPGLRMEDVPNIATQMAAFTPAGRAGGIGARVVASMGTEAGFQAGQGRAGGDVNATDIVLAGGGEALGSAVAAGARGIGRAMGRGAGEAAGEVATEADLGQVARMAATGGKKSDEAVAALAQAAEPNARAVRAAKALEIDVPADAYIDNPQLLQSIGLTRSMIGKDAAAEFETQIKTAIQQATDAMQRAGASFNEGAPNLSGVSERVRSTLMKSQKAIKAQAGRSFERVRALIGDPAAEIDVPNLAAYLDDKARALGGVDDLPADLKRYYQRIMADEPITYGWLDQLRRDIGQGYSRAGPFKDMAGKDLDDLYRALSRDQTEAVAMLGGDEATELLAQANKATQIYKGLQDRIVQNFGKDLEGSIATRLRGAVTAASKGDVSGLTRLMEAVPPELRKETLATAIAAIARSNTAGGRFGFAEFSRFYGSLKGNVEVMAAMRKHLGPEFMDMMENMAIISQRLTDIRGRVPTTGASMQAFMQAATAEGLVEKILGSTMVGRAAGAVLGATGITGAGPAGYVIADMVGNAVNAQSAKRLGAMGKMFASDQFKSVVEEAATQPKVADSTIRRLVRSSAFRRYMQAMNDPQLMSKPERAVLSWIQAAREQARAAMQEQEQ